jgi:hypothetical protein
MHSVYFDPDLADDERRRLLYEGQLFVYSPKPAALALCRFARELLEQAFPGLDPRKAQHALGKQEYAAILGRLKPHFINHARSKQLLQQLLSEFGCDPNQTYFDVPRIRTSTSDGYLTTGIAYAWHPHRDTWYSAPMCQVNWWMPVYEIEPSNAMAFHPRYWREGVANDSRHYDYGEWNEKYRFTAAQHTDKDPRPLPRATAPVEIEPQVRLVPPAGGMILFSGAQMHSSVPNTSGVTRISIDFRTVHLGDAMAFRGAPNVDSACTGTTMGDYLRGSDLVHIPAELIEAYDRRSREPVVRAGAVASLAAE